MATKFLDPLSRSQSNILSGVRFRKVYVCPVAGRRARGGSGVDSLREGVGWMGEGVRWNPLGFGFPARRTPGRCVPAPAHASCFFFLSFFVRRLVSFDATSC